MSIAVNQVWFFPYWCVLSTSMSNAFVSVASAPIINGEIDLQPPVAVSDSVGLEEVVNDAKVSTSGLPSAQHVANLDS